jgi:hypothetical protein
MKKQFKKEEVDFGCYFEPKNCVDRRHEFPESMDINGIINLEIPISDKFWFIYKNCNLSFNEMQILNLNLAKVNIAHYKELRGENALPEIIKITELHEQFVIKLINGDAADIPAYLAAYRAAYRAAYLAAYFAADIAADIAAYLAADIAADLAAYLAEYRVADLDADLDAYIAAENNILKMLKDFFVNPIIIQI